MTLSGWVLDDNLHYEEIPGLDHNYPTDWNGGSRNQQLWAFLTRQLENTVRRIAL